MTTLRSAGATPRTGTLTSRDLTYGLHNSTSSGSHTLEMTRSRDAVNTPPPKAAGANTPPGGAADEFNYSYYRLSYHSPDGMPVAAKSSSPTSSPSSPTSPPPEAVANDNVSHDSYQLGASRDSLLDLEEVLPRSGLHMQANGGSGVTQGTWGTQICSNGEVKCSERDGVCVPADECVADESTAPPAGRQTTVLGREPGAEDGDDGDALGASVLGSGPSPGVGRLERARRSLRRDAGESFEEWRTSLDEKENLQNDIPYILHRRHVSESESRSSQRRLHRQTLSLSTPAVTARPGGRQHRAHLDILRTRLMGTTPADRHLISMSRLPPRHSYSSVDDSMSPTTLMHGPTPRRAPLQEMEGPTASRAPLQEMHGSTPRRAPLQEMDGPTVSRAPLQEMDGPTASRAPLQEMHGSTPRRAPLQEMDSPTVSRAPLQEKLLQVGNRSVDQRKTKCVDGRHCRKPPHSNLGKSGNSCEENCCGQSQTITQDVEERRPVSALCSTGENFPKEAVASSFQKNDPWSASSLEDDENRNIDPDLPPPPPPLSPPTLVYATDTDVNFDIDNIVEPIFRACIDTEILPPLASAEISPDSDTEYPSDSELHETSALLASSPPSAAPGSYRARGDAAAACPEGALLLPPPPPDYCDDANGNSAGGLTDDDAVTSSQDDEDNEDEFFKQVSFPAELMRQAASAVHGGMPERSSPSSDEFTVTDGTDSRDDTLDILETLSNTSEEVCSRNS